MKNVLLVLILVMASCGTKKKAVTVHTVKKDVAINQKNDITTNAVITRQATKTTYTPADPDKPMVLPDGTTTTNAVVENDNETVETKTGTTDKSIIETEKNIKEKDKDLDLDVKKSNPYLWVYITIATLGVAFLVYRYVVKKATI